MLHLHFRIKFRAALITFGTIEATVPVPLPITAPEGEPVHVIVYNARGVLIEVYR